MVGRAVSSFLTASALIAVVAGALLAQESAAEFYDIARPTVLSGVVAGIISTPGFPRVYLLLETKDASGKTQRWAIEGDAMAVLIERGWSVRKGVPKLGDPLTMTTYPPKAGAKVVERVPSTETDVLTLAKEGRLVRGGEATLGGKKLVFGGNS